MIAVDLGIGLRSCLVRILRKINGVTLLLVWLLAAPVLRADFYVAPTGSDRNEGTEAEPFSTLERAREAIRELKRNGKFSAHGVTVWLRKGDYVRTNAFELTAADSGTANAPISWRAFGDERVRLLGGRILAGFVAVSDAGVLSRLDEKARGHVLQLNLREQDIQNFGEMKSRGFSRGAVSHCELFFGGRPVTLARWPNEGAWEKIAGFPETSGTSDDHGGKIGDLKGGFFYGGDRPRQWKDTTDLWVHGYWAWDWANSYERVESLDPDRRLVRTAPPHGLYFVGAEYR